MKKRILCIGPELSPSGIREALHDCEDCEIQSFPTMRDAVAVLQDAAFDVLIFNNPKPKLTIKTVALGPAVP